MKNVIACLRSEIRMFKEFINDTTGVISEFSKTVYKEYVIEYERAIKILIDNEDI